MSVVDRNPRNPNRVLRNAQRFRNGDATGSIKVTAPVTNTGTGISLSLLSTGGLNLNSSQLQIKLADSTLILNSSGIKVGTLSSTNLPADVAYVDVANTFTVAPQTFSSTLTGSSGTGKAFTLTPTISQSGTAGYDAFNINVHETSTGSGIRNLFNLQLEGVTAFRIDRLKNFIGQGNFVFSGAGLITSDFEVGGVGTFDSDVTILGGLEVVGTTNLDGNVNMSAVKANRFLGASSTVVLTAGAGAGTGPTVTATGWGSDGQITVVTGAAPSASSAIVTAAIGTFTSAPFVVFSPANAAAAALSGTASIFVTTTTTTFVLNSNTAALAAGTTYIWHFHLIG